MRISNKKLLRRRISFCQRASAFFTIFVISTPTPAFPTTNIRFSQLSPEWQSTVIQSELHENAPPFIKKIVPSEALPQASQELIFELQREYDDANIDRTDEYIRPLVALDEDGLPLALIQNGTYIMINHRGDRALPVMEALMSKNFNATGTDFPVKKDAKLNVIAMNHYSKQLEEWGVKAAYQEEKKQETISDIMVRHGVVQGRIAESNKGSHVTYFFDGRERISAETYQKNNIEVLITPSDKADDRDKDEAMKYKEVTNDAISFLDRHKDDENGVFAFVNYATDIQGHVFNGNTARAKKTLEATDEELRRLREKVLAQNGILIVTSDHGNVEEIMVLDETGNPVRDKDGVIPSTQHSRTSPVPFMIEGLGKGISLKKGMGLANIGATVLELLGLEKASHMAESLFENPEVIKNLIEQSGKKRPVVLVVRDGWGINKFTNPDLAEYGHGIQNKMNEAAKEWDATKIADLPVDELIRDKGVMTALKAHGTAVGLPDDQMGDSDNGHTTMGAGRVVPTVYGRILEELTNGDFYKNDVLVAGIRQAIQKNEDIIIGGLLSRGGVHSDDRYVDGILEMAKREGLLDSQSVIQLHVELDGRDVMTRIESQSGIYYLEHVLEKARELGIQNHVVIGSVNGRAYGMDRDAFNGKSKNPPEMTRMLYKGRQKIAYDARMFGVEDWFRADWEALQELDEMFSLAEAAPEKVRALTYRRYFFTFGVSEDQIKLLKRGMWYQQHAHLLTSDLNDADKWRRLLVSLDAAGISLDPEFWWKRFAELGKSLKGLKPIASRIENEKRITTFIYSLSGAIGKGNAKAQENISALKDGFNFLASQAEHLKFGPNFECTHFIAIKWKQVLQEEFKRAGTNSFSEWLEKVRAKSFGYKQRKLLEGRLRAESTRLLAEMERIRQGKEAISKIRDDLKAMIGAGINKDLASGKDAGKVLPILLPLRAA